MSLSLTFSLSLALTLALSLTLSLGFVLVLVLSLVLPLPWGRRVAFAFSALALSLCGSVRLRLVLFFVPADVVGDLPGSFGQIVLARSQFFCLAAPLCLSLQTLLNFSRSFEVLDIAAETRFLLVILCSPIFGQEQLQEGHQLGFDRRLLVQYVVDVSEQQGLAGQDIDDLFQRFSGAGAIHLFHGFLQRGRSSRIGLFHEFGQIRQVFLETRIAVRHLALLHRQLIATLGGGVGGVFAEGQASGGAERGEDDQPAGQPGPSMAVASQAHGPLPPGFPSQLYPISGSIEQAFL